LDAGDEVIIPSFCCSAAVAPILAVGATPVLADVGSELNVTVETIDAARTRKTRVIIVPHLFGNPADIGAIAELGNAKNIVVIDDAAQALGAMIDDQPAGSCGDMGVVSFGAEKVCFGLGGGALVAHSGGVLDAARQIVLGPPAVSHALARLTATLVRRRWRRWTLPAQVMLAQAKNPAAPPLPYRKEGMANLQAALAANLLAALGENLAARRARVDAYRELLGGCDGLELISHQPGSACLTQVIRLLPGRTGDRATALIAALGAAGIEVQGSYVPIHLLGWARQAVWDRLPFTAQVWEGLVELPCEPSVSMADVESIAALVKRILAA
jgi:dTDP-4-amino-4,6-dideoxygalactose transaminase